MLSSAVLPHFFAIIKRVLSDYSAMMAPYFPYFYPSFIL